MPDRFLDLFSGGVGAAAGVLGTILVALVQRKPALEGIIEARVRAVFEGYDRQVQRLSAEIAAVREENKALEAENAGLRRRVAQLEGRVDRIADGGAA